jgi:hypothetical protein
LTRRRGDAEKDAERSKDKFGGSSRIRTFPRWRAERAENAEEGMRRRALQKEK